MISFLWRKLWKNKWLTLCLLLGNILLVGIVTATPLFTTATMQRIFQEDMRYVQHSRNTFPAIMQLEYTLNHQNEGTRIDMYHYIQEQLWPSVIAELGVPSSMSVRAYSMSHISAMPYQLRENNPRPRQLSVLGAVGFADNIDIVHGRLPSDELVDGRIIEVVASESVMRNQNLIMNEIMVTNIDGSIGSYAGEPLLFKVVGVYEFAEDSDAFWSIMPFHAPTWPLASDRLLSSFMRDYGYDYWITAVFVEVLDFAQMHVLQVPHYQETILNTTDLFHSMGRRQWEFSINFFSTMQQYVARTERLAITLWVLQLPMYVMMALYIYMVSRQILLLDKNDVSVLHSRGASRKQILGIYILQGLFVGILSFPLGVGIGVLMCHTMGGSNGFLEIVQREALDVIITNQALLYGLIAVAFSFFTMLIPVRSFSKITIVDHKRKTTKKSIWQRYFLDVLCFGIAILGLYNFTVQQEHMAANLTEVQFVDPLLFVNSSFFIMGTGLLCLRLFPYLVKLVFAVGHRVFSPSVYASMLRVMRSAGEEQFIMLFLVFTVAVGTFSAHVARTINLNNDHRIQYIGGSDLVFREVWPDNVIPDIPPPYIVYFEPDFNRFLHFNEVDNLTQVMRRRIELAAPGSRINNMPMMAIDTRSFGETVWFRDDLLPIDINYFLNALALTPDGVLLSDNFRTVLGYSVGDIVTITDIPRLGLASSSRFVVVGFVEYWPAFDPIMRTRLPTGETRMTEVSFAITNLGHIITNWGMRPYQIWMDINENSTEFFHDFLQDNFVRVAEFDDTMSALVAIRSDPVVQGTNGVLTMSFIVTLLVCFTGFLIYWILSIKSRVLQFGIFRAMGLSMRNIISLLVNEQLFITLTALAIGGVVGIVSSRLFVPLIQLSYSAADQVLPLIITMEGRDYRNLYGVLAIMVVLCLLILASFISRIKITQALKLGED